MKQVPENKAREERIRHGTPTTHTPPNIAADAPVKDGKSMMFSLLKIQPVIVGMTG